MWSAIVSAIFVISCVFGDLVLAMDPHTDAPSPPIVLQTLRTSVGEGSARQATLTYTSTFPVNIYWTVDGEFPIQHLHPSVEVFNSNNMTDGSSTVVVPFGVTFDIITARLICSDQMYEIHLGIKGDTLMTEATRSVHPYIFYSPPVNEIGLSSTGQSMFHVFVNINGSNFRFGAVLADLLLDADDTSAVNVLKYSAYTFLPDDKSNAVRIQRVYATDKTYHANIFLNSASLGKTGGILRLISSCSSVSGIFTRMDIKQTFDILPNKTMPPFAENSVSFVKTGTESKIRIRPGERVLLRCMAVGNPVPVVTLTRKGRNGKRSLMPNVPVVITSYPFMTSAVFTLKDVRKLGWDFACKAESGTAVAYKSHKVRIIRQ